MHGAIRNPAITYRQDGTAAISELPGEVFTRRVITVVLGLVTALTFAFGFGNVWALGRALHVPALVAPLVGPAVDLSVAGLLIGIRHLSQSGVPRDQFRPARVLLMACGAATLALNIAGPVAAGAYGQAAFDSVGPALLIGWAETGPGLLRHLYAARSSRSGLSPEQGRSPAPAPDGLQGGSGSVRTGTGAGPDSRKRETTAVRRDDPRSAVPPAANLDKLLRNARRLDQQHRIERGRAVSAETLRKELRIGSNRARELVQQVREIHAVTAGDTNETAVGAPGLPSAPDKVINYFSAGAASKAR
jgi:hypothetical protein